MISAHERGFQKQRAFDHQFAEIDDVLDRRDRSTYANTTASSDRQSSDDRSSNWSNGRFTGSSRPLSSFSNMRSESLSQSSRSSYVGVSDTFNEDGRIRSDAVARWMEAKKQPVRSEAKVTRRGVDCRINLGGKVCEWVVFL